MKQRGHSDIPNAFTIRPAASEDLDVVSSISAAAYIPAYAKLFDWTPKPATEDYLPHICRGNVWILEQADEGPCGVLVVEEEPDHLLVYSVVVKPTCQGRGYARALLTHSDNLARYHSLGEVRLYTNTQMTDNINFYESCGFVKAGTRPHSRPGIVLQDMVKQI